VEEDKSYDVIPHPMRRAALPAMVPMIRGRKPALQASTKTGKGKKKVNKKKKPKQTKGLLNGVTLQDAADFLGAAWKWGRAALTLLPNVEEKYFDVSAAGAAAAIAGSATVVNLSNIAQGNDYNNRNGNSIRLMRVRLDFTAAGNALTALQQVRVLMFRDLMQAGTDPTVAQLLETTATSLAMNSPFLHYAFDRFEVLYDELLQFNSQDTFWFHRKMGFEVNDHILYQGTTGADASNWQGALYLLFIGDATTNQATVTYHSRLSFTDD
jgi:hypothetical protein